MLSKITRLILLVVSILISSLGSSHAQDPNSIQLPQVIPPNPVAMQYQKFVGYPVDASTGLVNISIPLYNLSIPGITIPFSLKYHASGIKVEDPYGSLGYGWSFFPGFRITRTVMGKLDEYYHTNNIQSQSTATVYNYSDYLANMATPASENDENSTTLDGQFDIFTIHLPTFDGGFILKWEGDSLKAFSIPDAPLKIGIVYAGAGSSYIGGFNVTDDKGIQYLFGNAYAATNNEYSEGGDLYATGWMLRKIILPGVNDTLLFHYNMIGAPNLSPSCNSFILYDNFQSNVVGDPSSLQYQLGMSGGCGSNTSSSMSYCGFTGTLRSFQSVEFPTGKVVVRYDSNSIAMLGMVVINSQQDTVKKISFTQANQLLTGVAVSGEGEYSFDYNSQRIVNVEDSYGFYPAVYQQDRWGYFNGQRNTSLIPSMTLTSLCGGGSGPITAGTANRDVDTAAMRASMLQQITYPTGGRTNFYYESHKFGSYFSPILGGGLRIKQMDTYDPISGKTITKTYKYGASETGLGHNSGFYPTDDSFIEERYLYVSNSGYNARCRRRTVNQASRWRFFGFNLPVWYSEVAEYSDGGKTVYNYDYAEDVVNTAYPSIGYDFMDNPAFSHLMDQLQYSNNIMMGAPSLAQKRVYKNDSNAYVLVHEEDYNYAPYHSGQVHGLIVEPLAYVVTDGTPRNYMWDSAHYNIYRFSTDGVSQTLWPFTYYDYYIVSGRNNLYSTVQHDYNNGQDFAITISNDYDSIHPYNLTSTQRINSKGDTLTEKYYYPVGSAIPDTSMLTSGQRQMVAMLKDSNRITTLIQKTSFKNTTTPLYSTLYGYKNWGNRILQPEQVYTKTGSNAYRSRLHFYNYDNKGNVVSVSKENDGPMSYLWDYSQTMPVAEVMNSDSASVAYTSFEADGGGNWTIGSTARDSTTAAITGRKSYDMSNGNLSKSGLSSGKNYIISYWSRSGVKSISGGSGSSRAGRTVSGWTYYEHAVTASSSIITISGSGLIDEIRLFPVGAQMTTYTHKPLIGLNTSADANSEISYYEYDSFNRLKNIKDYLGNIVKNFQYNFANSCGDNCVVLPMQTFTGSNTISYPVGVFNINGKLLGNASSQSAYITMWMGDTANSHTGTLTAGVDSMHFRLALNTGKMPPSAVTGLRYYQCDLAYTIIDAVRNNVGAYVDFGDGTGMRLGKAIDDTAGLVAPANTTIIIYPNSMVPYIQHTYPDTTLKTLTFYNNDSYANEGIGFDNYNNPATSLTRLKNLRGYLPQYLTGGIGGSCSQDSTFNTVANIVNWNSITTATNFSCGVGDGVNSWKNLRFAQDFMQNNRGLRGINTAGYNYYLAGYRDSTFKISRLKSDWNTYFTSIDYLGLNDEHWNREDVSALVNLKTFYLIAGNQKHSNDATNNPVVPIPSAAIDSILNQVASGAGQSVTGGYFGILSGGPSRTSASDAAVAQLISKGWNVYINGVLQTL